MCPDDDGIVSVTRLINRTCPYCSESLEHGSSTEHLVGRRFVPRGSLQGEWNLIMRACPRCNGIKGTLEDDLSAVTMYPPLVGPHPPGEDLRQEATRKARGSAGIRADRSPHKMTIGGTVFPGLTAKFEIVGPPAASEDQITHLAHMQLSGIFYWRTYDQELRMGRFWPGTFQVVNWAPRSDWGNPLQRAFSQMLASWTPCLLGTTARGFFKVAIRRPGSVGCFAWALEWNQNYRILGLLGDPNLVDTHARSLPPLQTILIGRLPDGKVSARTEMPLAVQDDNLFEFPEDPSPPCS